MTAVLNKQGCDAFYFIHESGLFKVRMGNFSSRKKADLRAAKLKSKNIITDYYIVPPRVYSLRGIQAKDERSIRKRLVYDASNFIIVI